MRALIPTFALLLAPTISQAAPGSQKPLVEVVEQALSPGRLAAPSLPGATPEAPAGDLDFDLLGEAPDSGPKVDPEAVSTRRTMLQAHTAIGIGLLLTEVSTLVLGQLDYHDRYGGGANSGRFHTPHRALAYSAMGLFLTNETLALLAPTPIQKQREGFDRITLHKIGLFTASAGMLASTGLGIYSAHFADAGQRPALAKTHLFIGYATYLAMAVGVSALVF